MASRAPWAAHFGLARTPFGKAIAAGDLFARQAHAQATARISFCIDRDPARRRSPGTSAPGRPWPSAPPSPGWIPPGTRSSTSPTPRSAPRGLYVQVVRALGAQPRYLKAELMAQAADLLAAETAERHRTVRAHRR